MGTTATTLQYLNIVLCYVVATTSAINTVNLGTSGQYSVLSKTGINATTASITGNVGTSPARAALLQGFDLTLSEDRTYSTSKMVNGKVFAADYSRPTPGNLNQAVSDMEAAYNDAAGRKNANKMDSQEGNLKAATFAPGVHAWGGSVHVAGELTFKGTDQDVFIMQIPGILKFLKVARIVFAGGAKPGNLFWQVGGATEFDPYSQSSGILLSKGGITMGQNSRFTGGKLLSQAFITLSGYNDI